MSAILIMGALAGLGLFLLIVALVPRRASLARQIAALDAARPARDRAAAAAASRTWPAGASR